MAAMGNRLTQRRREAEVAEKVRFRQDTLRNILSDSFTGEWGDECTSDDGVLVLRTVNFTNDGSISFEKTVRRSIKTSKVDAKKLKLGDIIVEKSGGTKDNPVGRVVYFDNSEGVFLTNNFTHVIRPDDTKVFPRYLLYVLLAYYKMKVTESLYNKTTGIQNLQINKYLDLKIPLPPLPEQKRIAATLDRICELKKNAETRLAKLDLLVKSRFVEMFGDPVLNPKKWPSKTIKEFASVRIGPFGSMLHKEDYVEGGYPLVNPSHIVGGQIVPDYSLTLSKMKYDELSVYKLMVGDVVIGRRGEIGRCAVVDSEGYFCGTGSMFVRIERDCTSDYLQRVISFPSYAAMLEQGAVGVTMKNLNAGMLEKSEIPLPPLSLQRDFAAFVEKVEKLKEIAKRSAEQMDVLYRSKLQEYFG